MDEWLKQGRKSAEGQAVRPSKTVSRIAAVVALAILGIAAGSSAAAPSRYLAYGDQQALVQLDNPAGLYPPLPLSSVQVHPGDTNDSTASLGGLHVETADPAFVTTDRCGLTQGARLVLCLTPDLVFNPSDQLQLLAWLSGPSTIYARTPRVAAYLRSVLAQLPQRLDTTFIADEAVPACSLACERVVVVEKVS
jgi:hypothetical protein